MICLCPVRSALISGEMVTSRSSYVWFSGSKRSPSASAWNTQMAYILIVKLEALRKTRPLVSDCTLFALTDAHQCTPVLQDKTGLFSPVPCQFANFCACPSIFFSTIGNIRTLPHPVYPSCKYVRQNVLQSCFVRFFPIILLLRWPLPMFALFRKLFVKSRNVFLNNLLSF